MGSNGYITKVFYTKKDIEDALEKHSKYALENNSGTEIGKFAMIYTEYLRYGCANFLIDSKIQKDIAKYFYCLDFNTPAYSGTYGKQPNKWIEKYYIIKQAVSKKEQIEMEKKKD